MRPAIGDAEWELTLRSIPTGVRQPAVRPGSSPEPERDLNPPAAQGFPIRMGEADRLAPPLDVDAQLSPMFSPLP